MKIFIIGGPGLTLEDKSLVPSADARLGATRFDWWLTHVPAPAAKKAAA